MSSVVALLFTDLVGSTELLQRLGDDAAEALRRRHFRALRDAVTSLGGQEVKNLGDGLMVVFDSVVDAVSCAVAMQQAVHRQNVQEAEALGVRVGVNAGEPIRDEEDYFGTPVAVAKRLCDAADGGQIIVSEVVAGLVGSRGEHEMVSLGALDLKGLAEPVPAREVRWKPTELQQVPLPQALQVVDRVSLVGRSAEMEALKAALKSSVSGGVRTALVSGEPGIGKTRLTSEFARRAHADGAVVLLGRCEEEPLAAYQPMVEALATYLVSATTDDIRAITGRHAPVLAELVPVLRDRLTDIPAAARVDPETDRLRLFDAVGHVLGVLAGRGPVLLLVEDVHWAQGPMLKLLQHLRLHAEGPGFLIVATYRETELARTHPLADVLAELRRDDESVVRVAVRGLDVDGVLAFLESASDVPLPPQAHDLAVQLHRTTEGNPFFVRELLRHLIETGAVEQSEDTWTVAPIETMGIPEGVKEVVGRRLSRLSEEANATLRIAAVIGREFDLSLLVAVAEGSEDTVLGLIEQAVEARVVDEAPEVLDRFTFSHALVRETLLDELTTSRRVRLHRSVGEAIEAANADDPGPHLAQLAYHFGEAAAAGATDQAIEYGRRAAQRAFALNAFEEADDHLGRSLAVLEEAGLDDDRLRCELLVELSHARAAMSADEGRSAALPAVELARRVGDPELFAQVARAVAGDFARIASGIDEEAWSVLAEALDGLGDQPSALRSRILSRMAHEHMFDPGTALPYAERALADARVVGDDAALAFALWMQGLGLAVTPDRIDVLESLAEESRAAANRSGEHAVLGIASWMEISTLMTRGETERAKARTTELIAEAADMHRSTSVMYYGRVWRAMFAMHDGALDDADRLIHEAFEFGQSVGNTLTQNQYSAQLYALRRLQGRSLELEPLMKMLREADPDLPWGVALGQIYADAGRLDDARSVFESMMANGLETYSGDVNYPIVVAILSDVAWQLDHEEHAPALAGAMAPWEGLTVLAGIPCAIAGGWDSYRSRIVAVLGRYAEAYELMDASIEFEERKLGSRVYAFWHRLLKAEMRLRDPDGDRALALREIEGVLPALRELGIATAVADGEALVDRLTAETIT